MYNSVPFWEKLDQMSNVYQSFFSNIKAVEFRPTSGEVLLPIHFVYFTEANYSLSFSLRTPNGNGVLHTKKTKTNQSECVQRQSERIKTRADSRASQSHPQRHHCMGTTATSINGHSGARCWARFPQRNISKGGLGRLPSAFRSLQLLCAIRTKLRLSNYVVKCFDLNASLLVLIITSLKGGELHFTKSKNKVNFPS